MYELHLYSSDSVHWKIQSVCVRVTAAVEATCHFQSSAFPVTDLDGSY